VERRTPPEGALLHVLIRPAEPADAVAIGAVWQRAALTAYEGIFPESAPKPTSEGLAERSRQAIADQGYNRLVLVACTPGPERAVVGTIGALPDPEVSTRAQLVRLYVDPGHWGRGIGRRLHDQALAHLERAGYRVVVLWVLEANARARAMYERWGWRATPGRKTSYPGVDEVCYLLAL
jgi:ribosomal protein S18 acetylase RimI-like enzyme